MVCLTRPYTYPNEMKRYIKRKTAAIFFLTLFKTGCMRKKEEIWLSPMTKAPYTYRKIEKATRQHKNFDYTTIAGRLRTVSGSNNGHPTGVVKPIY